MAAECACECARVCVCVCVRFVQVCALRLPLEVCSSSSSLYVSAATQGTARFGFACLLLCLHTACSRHAPLPAPLPTLGLLSTLSSVDFVLLIKYVHASRDPNSNADKNIIKNCSPSYIALRCLCIIRNDENPVWLFMRAA